MPVELDIEELKKRLATIESWLAGVQKECQNTRKLLEEADVSTSATTNTISKISIEARTRLRSQILK